MNIPAIYDVTPWGKGIPTGVEKALRNGATIRDSRPKDGEDLALRCFSWRHQLGFTLDSGKRIRLKWLLLRGREPWSPSSELGLHSVGMAHHGGFSSGGRPICAAARGGVRGELGLKRR